VRVVRKRRAGFTLTEILMAVGILGIGLSMVATIFPVAIDANRYSADLTQAALYARSTYALMRARRYSLYSSLRTAVTPTTTPPCAELDETDKTGQAKALPQSAVYCVYNPFEFTYSGSSSGREELDDANRYNIDNFAGPVYATPLAAGGPYRLAFIVCKGRGALPDVAADASSKSAGGDYVFDRSSGRGEAYLVDYRNGSSVISAAPLASSSSATYLFSNTTNLIRTGGQNSITEPTQSPAVIAFHALLGD